MREQAQAIDELLAHIDALEQAAAERVIDSGRLEAAEALAERLGGMVERMKQGIKPSTAERCAARWAMSSAVDRGSFERGWDAREAEGSRSPTPDYAGEGSAWVPPAEAQAVVVPELTEEDLVRAGRPYCINDREPFERGARWAAAFIRERARAIPADRVLREEEARIGMNELLMLRCFAGRLMSEREYGRLEAVRDAHEEALRANQGGAAT